MVFRENITSCTYADGSRFNDFSHGKAQSLIIERPLSMVLTDSTGSWTTEKVEVLPAKNLKLISI